MKEIYMRTFVDGLNTLVNKALNFVRRRLLIQTVYRKQIADTQKCHLHIIIYIYTFIDQLVLFYSKWGPITPPLPFAPICSSHLLKPRRQVISLRPSISDTTAVVAPDHL